MRGTAVYYAARHDEQLQNFDSNGTAATMMYGVTQPGSQHPTYNTQQFSSGLSMAQPSYGSSRFANDYQQDNAMNCASNSISSVSAMPQAAASPDVSMDNHENGEGTLEERWIEYQQQLGTIFQKIVSGSLESASETLLSVTNWLLSQVAELGLNLDDSNLHADRIQLWNDFNHAWLGLGQRQIDLMIANQQPSRSQSLIPKAMVEKMGNELIWLCDGIERHGLVNYQYGVWEDQITAVLEHILDLYETSEEDGKKDDQ